MKLFTLGMSVSLILLFTGCSRQGVYADLPISTVQACTANCSALPAASPTPTPNPGPFAVNFALADVFSHLNATRYFTGDFNGDGKTDIAFALGDGKIYLGISDGHHFNFAPTAAYFDERWKAPFALNSGTRFFVADFNHDGKADLAFVSNDGAIWIGLCDGTNFHFSNPFRLPEWGPVFDEHSEARFFQGDFNGDGIPDLAFTWINGTVQVGIYDGSTFHFKTTYFDPRWKDVFAASSPARFFAADFDGNGKTDIAFTYSDGNIWMARGDSDSMPFNLVYQEPLWGPVFEAHSQARFFIGDFNGDGHADLAFTWPDGTIWIAIFAGTNFAFQPAFQATVESGWRASVFEMTSTATFIAGDFDGDGKTDMTILMADGEVWMAPSVLDTNGDVKMQFSRGNRLPFLGLGFSARANPRFFGGDFDGDHKMDFGYFWTDGSIWAGLGKTDHYQFW